MESLHDKENGPVTLLEWALTRKVSTGLFSHTLMVMDPVKNEV